MGVGVDQTRHDEPVRRIDHDGVFGRVDAGRADLDDGIAGDDDIGEISTASFGVEDTAAANDLIG